MPPGCKAHRGLRHGRYYAARYLKAKK
jgi:hypothetical protein